MTGMKEEDQRRQKGERGEHLWLGGKERALAPKPEEVLITLPQLFPPPQSELPGQAQRPGAA